MVSKYLIGGLIMSTRILQPDEIADATLRDLIARGPPRLKRLAHEILFAREVAGIMIDHAQACANIAARRD
jgi:hypothetical protein